MSKKMSKQVRVNVRATVNAAQIRRERKNGRDYIIVPSATMPDGIVMNGVRYDAEEIRKGFPSLENTPAPLGHPTIEGAFVSASDPEGLARGWIGAWNRNVRQEGGRVLVDKVIDVATASQLEGGKAVLEAINKGEAIHTSTGLYAILDPVENPTDGAAYTARGIVFDHDAILLGEEGAATPAQGVGMLVHKAVGSAGEEIEVLNSALEDAERDFEWAVETAVRAVERMERAPFLERIKSAIKEAILGSERETSNNQKETAMPVTDEQFQALSAEVTALSECVKTFETNMASKLSEALKPLADKLAADAAAAEAQANAKKADLVTRVVEANLLPEPVANTLSIESLEALMESVKPKKAPALNGARPDTTETGGFKLPSAE